jgi:Zn-dependent peptidase ImmA (M78 family)/DNA-binding XRE family transcriptional regulator
MNTLGAAIEMARRAGGWTQEEIAERANVTQATLSRWEHDLRVPSEDDLLAVATALGVTPDLLLHGRDLRGAMGVDAHMRRQRTAPAKTWRQLEARLNIHRLRASKLFDHINMRAEADVPSFDPFETTPEDAARLVRMQWRMPLGPVRQLIGWLEAAGCLVIEEDFGTRRVDGLSQWVADHPVVLTNSASPTDRKRLTVAHELGHLVLHRSEPTPDVEGDANAFAAEFLMPAEVIRPQLRKPTLGSLIALKSEWGVSVQALIERAAQLKTITPAQRTTLWKRISSLGWRTQEPYSDELPPERPRLAASIGEALVSSGLEANDIAKVVGYPPGVPLGPYEASTRRLRSV